MQKRYFDHTALTRVQGRTALTTTEVDGTAYVRKHGDALGLIIPFDYSADGDATYTITLQHRDSGGSWADCAAADYRAKVGSIGSALTQAALAALSIVDTVVVDYIGTKDEVRIQVLPANHASGTNFSVYAVESGMKLSTGSN